MEKVMPVNSINDEYYKQFCKYIDVPIVWDGKTPQQWLQSSLKGYVGNYDSLRGEIPNSKLSIFDVKEFCSDKKNSDEACYVVIMSWGGQSARNARLSWEHGGWRKLVRALREGKLSGTRREIFDAFQEADISGLGPSYFTKIMFFLGEQYCCYILDQWTAHSANLLVATNPPRQHPGLIAFVNKIEKTRRMSVSRSNTGIEYESYCLLVEELATKVGRTPNHIEQAMFSGGKNHPWREFLKANFSKTFSKSHR